MRPLALLPVILPAALAAATPAAACPEVADTTAARAALVAEMQAAPNQMVADAAMKRLWTLLTRAPDPEAQALLDTGMHQRDAQDFDVAKASFDRLVALCPAYPEGYNQRAFVEFLQGAYPAALADLDVVLKAQPNHVAALAGKAEVLGAMGREAEGQANLRAAVALNPWLPERGLLRELPGKSL